MPTLVEYQAAARKLTTSQLSEGWKPSALHPYTFGDGQIHYCVIRMERTNADGKHEKWIRPIHLDQDGKASLTKPPAPVPEGNLIYNLDQIVRREGETVWVVEGEKCADALTKLGLLATTSGAADSDKKADWNVLAGRDVVIWPDNDTAGVSYMEGVKKRLAGIASEVSQINPVELGLGNKQDCVDWLKLNQNVTAEDVLNLPTYEFVGAENSDSDKPSVANDYGIEFLYADEIEPEPTDWLWKGWLARGDFSLLAGAQKVGKSTLTTALAATLSVGGRFPDGQTAKVGRTLIVSFEDRPKKTVLPRIIAAGADRSCVVILNTKPKNKKEFNLATDVPNLKEKILDLQATRGVFDLIIIDPVVMAVSGDSHKNTEVRRGLHPIIELAEVCNAAVVGITHFGKGTSGRELAERALGSVAFSAVARANLVAIKDNNQAGRYILGLANGTNAKPVKSIEYFIKDANAGKDGECETSYIEFGQQIEGDVYDIVTSVERRDVEETNKQAECEAWLANLLQNGEMLKKDVLHAGDYEGFSQRTVERVASKIAFRDTEKRKGGGAVWRLKIQGSPNTGSWRTLTLGTENSSIDEGFKPIQPSPTQPSPKTLGEGKTVKIEV